MKKLYVVFYLLFLSNFIMAQTGIVRGIITDATSGDAIPFANVFIEETSTGFSSDLDGAYSYDLPVGNYTFEVSYVGYSPLKIEGVNIIAGEITTINIEIKEEGQNLEEIVVTAKQLKNTENAVLAIQRKSVNVVNGVSSQSFKKSGDSNAGAAVKRVTGVSIDGGKYVFVRGLGDRYSKTTLNGLEIPGLDPDRNSLQLDIFPTNIIDNIMVSKTPMSNLPGDFTGGIIDIATKDFPEQKTVSVSLGLSYNPNMHFKSNYLSSANSNTDFLGFDNGLRDLKINKLQQVPGPVDDPNLTQITSRFENNMATEQSKSLANMNIGLSLGNQINKGKATIGYNATVGYRNNTVFFQDVLFNNYIKSSDNKEMELLADRKSKGDLGVNTVLLSSMVGGAIKYKKHKLSLMALHLQNGKSKAGLFERNSFIRASNSILRDNVEYTQSNISNFLLTGTHALNNTFKINWKLSPTFSSIEDKDIRVTPFRLNDDQSLTIEPSEGAQPRRLWRNLDETNYSGKIDVIKSFDFFNQPIDFKFGLSNTYKERGYEILSYLVNVKGQSQLNFTGDPNELLLPENIWTPEKQIGTYIAGNFEPTNTYDASQNIFGTYVMTDIKLINNLKANVGLRMEKFSHHYTGQNNTGSVIYDNEKIIDQIDFLPAVNLVYSLGNSMNLRGAFSKTLARPSFKEASIAQIYDAISDRTFIGNIDLQQTNISNYDIRWEAFYSNGQMFSISGFYKSFVNPIEIVAFSSSAPNDLQPRNVGNAKVTGVEVEFRKNLAFISRGLESFYIGANLTFVKSEVALDKSENGEFESRELNSRVGESIKSNRQMQGQAPYIVNAYMNYVNKDKAWEVNLSYNVQGSSLAIVGIGLNPDVYTSPYHDMSFKASKRIGKRKQLGLSVGANNLLNANKIKVYKSHGANDQIFEQFRPYRTFNLGLSWKL